MKIKGRAGFTLVEVLVATTLMATTVAYLYPALIESGRLVTQPNTTAGGMMRGEMDLLNDAVRNDTMNTGALSVGVHQLTTMSRNGSTYTRSYEVVSVNINPLQDNIEDYRIVKGLAQWTS